MASTTATDNVENLTLEQQMQRAAAHIPTDLHDSVLEMRPAKAQTGNCPTFFIGIVDQDYTDEVWNSHKARISSLFDISPDCCCDIRAGGVAGTKALDIQKLQQKIKGAIDKINNETDGITSKIRIVGLGQGSSQGLTDAIEALIRGWKRLPNEKSVQFIAMGESEKFHYLNFCRNLCMKELCGALQYYNTMDYSPFGYLRPEDPTTRGLKKSRGDNTSSKSGQKNKQKVSNVVDGDERKLHMLKHLQQQLQSGGTQVVFKKPNDGVSVQDLIHGLPDDDDPSD